MTKSIHAVNSYLQPPSKFKIYNMTLFPSNLYVRILVAVCICCCCLLLLLLLLCCCCCCVVVVVVVVVVFVVDVQTIALDEKHFNEKNIELI